MNRHWELRKIAYEFAYLVEPRNFLHHWEENSQLLQDCRMVFSDPCLGDSPLPGKLSARTFGQAPQAHLNSFFANPGFIFLTNDLVQMHRNGYNARSPMVDWSVALDSNFIGDIHKFMTGKSLETRWPAFLEAATFILTHHINTDATPYLFENFQKAKDDPKHFDFVVNGFATFYRFTTGHVLTPVPSSLSDFDFSMSEDEAKHFAKKTVQDMLNNPLMMEQETHHLWHRQDTHLALLLTAIEYYGQRRSSIKEKIHWILQSLEKYVGRIPEREIMFAYRAFSNANRSSFFSNQWPIPYNRKQNIVDLVRNMAWDISFFRNMQTWATKKDKGDYAVPYFLTFDWKLSELNDIYTCRILLLDDRDKKVYSLSRSNVQREFENAGFWDDFQQFFTQERVLTRMRTKVTYDALVLRCRDAENELRRIVYAIE